MFSPAETIPSQSLQGFMTMYLGIVPFHPYRRGMPVQHLTHVVLPFGNCSGFVSHACGAG